MSILFYLFLQLRYGERILTEPLIYIALTATGWGTAIAFYLRETTSWEVTPAHSRQYNQDCILLNFYDTHDIWHFLSAGAIFVGFMVSFLCTNIP